MDRASQTLRRAVGMDTEVRLREHAVFIPELSPEHDGIRIAHLSDLHIGTVTPDARIRRAVAMARDASPDLCVLTGDFASRRRRSVQRIAGLLEGLPEQSYFVLGNHDHNVDPTAVADQLQRAGAHHLDNRHHTVELRGEALHLIGLDDPVTRKHRPDEAISRLPPGGTRVLLSHLAESLGEVLDLGEHVHLCLSGHTHGGQIYLRGLTRPLMSRAGLSHIRGLERFQGGGPWLHVTHGVGSAVNPLRVDAHPEVALLTLRRDRRRLFYSGL